MQTDPLRLAAYLPKESAFVALVKETYRVTDLEPYRRETNILPFAGLQNEDYGTPFAAMKPPTEMPVDASEEEPDAVEETASNDKAVALLDDYAKRIRGQVHKDDQPVFHANKINITINEKAERGALNQRVRKVIRDVSVAVAATYISTVLLAADTPDTETPTQPTYYVETSAGNLNIRKEPRTDVLDNILLSVRPGTLVTVKGEAGEFYEINCEDVGIEDENERCFASKQYLRPIMPRSK